MRRWLALALLAALPGLASAQSRPGEDLEAIVALLESGEPARAETELRKVLSAGDSAAARDLLGVALGRQGRLEEAEREFARAIELAPGALAPRQHRSRVLLQTGRGAQALSELRAAARLGPLERDLALWLAAEEASRGNAAAAEEHLLSVVERFDSVRALMQLARLAARSGQNGRALGFLERARAIAPNSEEVLSAFARLSLTIAAPMPALRALEPLTRMNPVVADHHYLLGVARMQIGEMAGADEALRRSLELEPTRAVTWVALGLALNGQKRFTEAKEALLESLKLDPGNVEALAALAEAEEGTNELAGAELHALRALERDDSHARAHLVLGKIRMTQGRYGEARDALQRAVAGEPDSPKAHYQLSLAYARLGDVENSKKHRELYRLALREAEQLLADARTHAGLGAGGMKP